MNEDLQKYRDDMESPMEALAISLWGLGSSGDIGANMRDCEIVEFASRKIGMLQKMLVAAGVPEEIVKLAVSQ